MKQIVIIILLLMVGQISVAQEALVVSSPSEIKKSDWSVDLGMWGWTSGKTFTPSSWNMFYYNGNLFEVRYNFDRNNSLSLYYGHRFRTEKSKITLDFTPAVGVQVATDNSGYTGVALTTHTIFDTNRFKAYTVNQYQRDVSGGNSHQFYNWIDASFRLNKWLNVGVSDQIFYTDEFSYDIGPSIGFEAGNFYGKVYGWDLWSNSERYFGIWFGTYISSK